MAGTSATAYWVNFRSTLAPSGFTGDDATFDVYNLGGTGGYPFTGHEIGGVWPQGWVGGGPVMNDDATYNIRHSGGNNSTTNGSKWFRISGLTSGHVYRLWMGIMTTTGTATVGCQIFKDAGSTAIPGGDVTYTSLPSGKFCDITGVLRTDYTDWNNNQAYLDYTCSGTTDLYFGRGSNLAGCFLNAVGIEDMSASPPVTALGSTFMMMGV